MSYHKSGKINERILTPEDRMLNLSYSVNAACDAFFRSRGMSCGSMRDQITRSIEKTHKNKKRKQIEKR